MAKKRALIPGEQIEKSILTIRGQRVILDADLAAIYGVTTTRLNQQVRRNRDRFPADFAYLLTQPEFTTAARVCDIDVAKCNIKDGPRRATKAAFRFHRVRRRNGRQCFFDAIRQLMIPPQTSRPQIGFHAKPQQ
jgi:hypothetical protein